jgi:hypothetical protein
MVRSHAAAGAAMTENELPLASVKATKAAAPKAAKAAAAAARRVARAPT